MVVTLPEIVRRMTQVLRIGLTPDPEFDPATRIDELRIPVQSLYRAWNLRESELDRTRPFFGDEDVRAKIRPIEVEVIPPKLVPPTPAQAVDKVTTERRGPARRMTAARGVNPSPKRATGVVLEDLGRPGRGDEG